LLVAAVAVASACTSTPTDRAVRSAGRPSVSPAPPPSTPPAAEQTVTFAFAGDVHFTGRTDALLRNPATAIGPFTAQLSAADLAMVNLESAITTRGTPEPKRFHFRAPPTAYEALRDGGIDVASIGNNHALDYGRVGLADTLDSAKAAGFPVVGAGRNVDEAYAPYLTTIRGVRIAILAMSQVHELAEPWRPTATRSGIAMAHDRDRSVAAVRAAREKADVVIVFLHWGTERSRCPNGEQRSFAAAMADAGATIVVGTHAHVPIAGGYIGKTYVHYGLGNFVWYISNNTDSVLLGVTVTARPGGGPDRARVTGTKITPGLIGPTGQPRPVSGSAATGITARLAASQACARLAQAPTS
jgi:poly-gamma-glutamate synthesis protein (capsule biosynthesis protein)